MGCLIGTANRVDGISVHACIKSVHLCVRTSIVCNVSFGWEEFWGADGQFLDVNGEPLMGKINV
jgi:hypothetical protein